MLIILSLYGGEGQQRKKQIKKLGGDYCSLEALDTNVSMVMVSMTSWGRSFQSLMVLGRNEYCWYWVLQCGFFYSSSSCEATAIVVLIILSLCQQRKKKKEEKKVLDYCSLE